MLKIEVTNEAVIERKGTKDGRDWVRREQPAYVHTGNAYPSRFLINLGTKPQFAPGHYMLDPRSVVVGQYGDLQFGRELILVQDKPAIAKAG